MPGNSSTLPWAGPSPTSELLVAILHHTCPTGRILIGNVFQQARLGCPVACQRETGLSSFSRYYRRERF